MTFPLAVVTVLFAQSITSQSDSGNIPAYFILTKAPTLSSESIVSHWFNLKGNPLPDSSRRGTMLGPALPMILQGVG